MRALGLFVLTMLPLAAPPAGPDAAGSESLPFRLDRPGRIVVPVTVNGDGPFSFLLDTGASHSAVSAKLAAKLGARRVARTEVTSTLGRELREVVLLTHLAFGPVVAQGVLASVVPGRLDPSGRIQGLIGQDLLASRTYTLDFRSNEIAWPVSSAEALRRGQALQLECERGWCMVELPQKRTVLRLVPDSGADALVLFDRANRPPLRLITGHGFVEVATVSARRLARPARLDELRLGTARLRDVRAVLVPPDDFYHPPGDGLLPVHIFDRVTFDIRQRRLIIETRGFDTN